MDQFAGSSSPPVLSGDIYKRSREGASGRWSGWAFRHAVVRAGTLTYAKSEFDAKPQGSLSLFSLREVAHVTLSGAGGRQHAIELTLAGGKAFQVGLRDKPQRDAWFDLLKGVQRVNAMATGAPG